MFLIPQFSHQQRVKLTDAMKHGKKTRKHVPPPPLDDQQVSTLHLGSNLEESSPATMVIESPQFLGLLNTPSIQRPLYGLQIGVAPNYWVPDPFAAVQKMYITWTKNEHAAVAKPWFCIMWHVKMYHCGFRKLLVFYTVIILQWHHQHQHHHHHGSSSSSSLSSSS